VSDRATEPADTGRAGWLYTALTVLPSFAYLLALSVSPATLARPWQQGSRISIGLLLGLALAVLIAAASASYTWQMNRRQWP
jgi:hypothetical protein